jgi:hypothetical protein
VFDGGIQWKICAARRLEKVAEVWRARAVVDDLFLNFLFLFVSFCFQDKKKKRNFWYKVPDIT